MAHTATRPREDFSDYRGLGIGVVPGAVPIAQCQPAPGARVQVALVRVSSKPAAEEQHALHFRTTGGEDVEVDPDAGAMEQAVLVPFGFAEVERIAGLFESGRCR